MKTFVPSSTVAAPASNVPVHGGGLTINSTVPKKSQLIEDYTILDGIISNICLIPEAYYQLLKGSSRLSSP